MIVIDNCICVVEQRKYYKAIDCKLASWHLPIQLDSIFLTDNYVVRKHLTTQYTPKV